MNRQLDLMYDFAFSFDSRSARTAELLYSEALSQNFAPYYFSNELQNQYGLPVETLATSIYRQMCSVIVASPHYGKSEATMREKELILEALNSHEHFYVLYFYDRKKDLDDIGKLITETARNRFVSYPMSNGITHTVERFREALRENANSFRRSSVA